MNDLYKKSHYLADNKFIISNYIREYDIRQANISILFEKGYITLKDYEKYRCMDKMQREISIGYLLKHKSISDALSMGLKEYRNKFLNDNDIEEYNVLSIKNDAIYLVNIMPLKTRFDRVIEFLNKNIYTSFYRINNLELYYKSPTIDSDEILHVKGISDEALKFHKNYFYDFLCEVFYCAENENISEVINLIQNFYKQYINLELDIGYYRNFDSTSNYVSYINTISNSTYSFIDNYIPNTIEYKKVLNISYNLNIIRILYSYYASLSF